MCSKNKALLVSKSFIVIFSAAKVTKQLKASVFISTLKTILNHSWLMHMQVIWNPGFEGIKTKLHLNYGWLIDSLDMLKSLNSNVVDWIKQESI